MTKHEIDFYVRNN